MGNFSRGSSNRGGFGGRSGGFRGKPGGFGGRPSGGFRGRDFGGPMQKFDATCSKCGKACQVPFKPTGKKPILCSDCFRQSGNARDSPRGMSSQPGVSQEQFKQISAKLDKILSILKELEIYEGADDDTDEDDDKGEDINEGKAEPKEKAKPKAPSKDSAADDDEDDDEDEEEGTDEVEEADEDEAKSEDIKE